MTKLNDIQLIVLSGAAQRESGSLLPPPASVADAGERLNTAITSLQKLGLIVEGPAKNAKTTWRTEVDHRIGIFITDAGRSAINLESGGDAGKSGSVASKIPDPRKPERQTKSATVVALLQRAEGATLAEVVAATAWQRHTTRAALTGFRKKGFSIEKGKRGEVTCYRITGKA